MAWTTLDLSTEHSRKEGASFAEALMRKSNVFHLRYDLHWMLCGKEPADDVSVYVYKDQEGSLGYVLSFRHDRPLKFQLGELAFYQKALVRYELWSEPLIVESPSRVGQRKSIILKLLRDLRVDMNADEVISIEGLPTSSDFFDLLQNEPLIGQDYLILFLGRPFEHQFIKMPDSYDEYIQSLGKRSRKSLKYSRHKLHRDCSNDVVVECFETGESVEKFLEDAIEISKKTYQWRLLGLGLRDYHSIKRRLCFAAAEGYFRSYILYCRGQPTAFLLGYQHFGRFYYMDVGYDPAWADWSVGSVLQLEVLAHLYAREDRPEIFDFSTGYGQHKGRFGNFSQEEVNLLLLPRTFRSALLVRAYCATLGISDFATELLDRVGLKAILKRGLRRFASARG